MIDGDQSANEGAESVEGKKWVKEKKQKAHQHMWKQWS